MLGAVARTLGMEKRSLPQFSGSGKSFFLTRLLKEVIFQEANLAGANRRTERYYQWLHWAGYALVGVLGIGLLAMWYNSYSGNRELVARADVLQDTVAAEAQKVSKEQRDLPVVLTALDNAAKLNAGYDQNGWDMKLGLYQGDKIAQGAANGYRNMLENGLLPRLVLYIEDKLRKLTKPDELFEALKVYLMLDDPRQYEDDQTALAGAAENAQQIHQWLQQRL
jgi:type VI secretion system protein ImpL